MTDRMEVSLAEILKLRAFDGAKIVAGAHGLAERTVEWASPVEWPVEGFVSPRELVMTTGIGCDDEMLARTVNAIDRVGAAGLVVSQDPASTQAGRYEVLRREALRRDVPLVEVPWDRSFSELARATIGFLIERRYEADPRTADQLHLQFMDALLRGEGIGGVVETLERMTSRPALVLSLDVRPLAWSRLAETAGASSVSSAALGLNGSSIRRLRSLLSGVGIRRIPEVTELGLGPGSVEVLTAQGEALGFLYLLDGETSHGAGGFPLAEHAVQQAALAASLELMREQTLARALGAWQGDALWALVDGAEPTAQIERIRRLRPLDWHDSYRVVVGLAEPGIELPEAADVERAIRVALPGAVAAVRAEETLFLLPSDRSNASPSPSALAAALERVEESSLIAWGSEIKACSLRELATGYRRSKQMARVGRTILGPGRVATEELLGPVLALGAVLDDPEANMTAREPLRPLVDYDERSGRSLVRTLEVLLEEQGNQSAAARRLHLNRHSLLYRAKKIEALTGRSLRSSDDRFQLELALRVVKATRE